MKQITYILTFLFLTSCGQSNSDNNTKLEISAETDTIKKESKADAKKQDLKQNSIDQNEQNNQDLSNEFNDATLYKLTETITADFNGDGKVDQAIFKKENETSGIIIFHGEKNEEVKIGFGERISNLTEFNWVDFWGILKDSKTYETIIEDAEIIGGREVKLDNPSIIVRNGEAGGGLITFKEGKYVWIHQAD